MDRVEKILYKINKQGKGLEIGPSHSPIASKSDGFDVEIIDCMDKESLIEHFKNDPVDITKIEEVDHVWKGESYSALTKKPNYYDWILSSHSIEHTTDLIGFLNDCDNILKDDGVISLAIPDKRYYFDYFRPASGIGKIIDYYRNKNVRHSYGTHIEFSLNFCERDSVSSWPEGSEGIFSLNYDASTALSIAENAETSPEYTDAHEWCFTYSSFRLIIQDLYELGFIKLREVHSFPSTGNEFHITLGRHGAGTNKSRLDLLADIDAENIRSTPEEKKGEKVVEKKWWQTFFK